MRYSTVGLSEREIDILRAAISFTKGQGTLSVARLRRQLLVCFPGEGRAIANALQIWASQAAMALRGGVESVKNGASPFPA